MTTETEVQSCLYAHWADCEILLKKITAWSILLHEPFSGIGIPAVTLYITLVMEKYFFAL